MKTVFVSATGNYMQGDLTPQLFRDLCASYDPSIYEAGAFVAHSTKWNDAGVSEPPRLAAVKSLSDSFIGTGGRVFLSTDIEPNADYDDAQQYFPHKSIEFWDATDPRNPLNQPHIPAEKRGKPYFRGYALLGDSPAAKLPASITKFFGELTAEKRAELSQYCDEKSGLYCYKDTTKNETTKSMSKIGKALGLPETATEEQIITEINKVKEPAGEQAGAEYQDKITALETEIASLKENASTGVKEYSDKLTAAEIQISALKTERHDLIVAGMVKEAQAKNVTVGAEKLERIKTYADRDFKDGDGKYTLAKAYLADIPEVKPASVGRVPGETPSKNCPAKSEIKTYSDLLKLPGKQISAFNEAHPEYVAELRSER